MIWIAAAVVGWSLTACIAAAVIGRAISSRDLQVPS
jgi:hypothetical protein